jgi:hypothetical protein
MKVTLHTAGVQALQATVHHTAGAPHLLAVQATVPVRQAVAIAEAVPEEVEAIAGAAREDTDRNSIKLITT